MSGPKDLDGWIVCLFEPLPGLLAGADGHRETWLLEVKHPGPDCCVVSLTVWDSIEDYSRQEPDGFAAVFRAARADGQRFGTLSPLRRYDLPGRPLPDLKAAILEQVGADYPRVRVGDASLRGLSWSVAQRAPLRASLAGSAAASRAGAAFDG
jgi:hypothetical protein